MYSIQHLKHTTQKHMQIKAKGIDCYLLLYVLRIGRLWCFFLPHWGFMQREPWRDEVIVGQIVLECWKMNLSMRPEHFHSVIRDHKMHCITSTGMGSAIVCSWLDWWVLYYLWKGNSISCLRRDGLWLTPRHSLDILIKINQRQMNSGLLCKPCSTTKQGCHDDIFQMLQKLKNKRKVSQGSILLLRRV